MHDISKSYFDAGYNVYNCKLPGHFEINKTQLDSTNRAEWYASMKRDIEMAKKLGDKVVIVGHSLGGSLALRAALEYPELVNGVVLLAPGLELDRWQAIKVWMTNRSWFGMGPTLMKLFGISRTDKYQRYLSSAAAVQEGLILEDILAMAPDKEDLYRRMNQTAVMMVNTKAETTINEDVNLLAISKLMNREHHPLSRSLIVPNVLHRSVPVADPNENPDFPIIEKETIDFLDDMNKE
jgi:alpha-beta hydrolase superfamily lysophospholipase